MWLIRNRKITYIISGLLVASAVAFTALWGLKLGIDFTGGSLLEVEYRGAPPASDTLQKDLSDAGITDAVIQPTGEHGLIIRTAALSEDQHQRAVAVLKKEGELTEKSFDAIGPTIGKELQRDSVYAIILVIMLIVAYIAFAFRKVSEPVQSWKYGVATIIALVHDVVIPVGAFALLGRFFGYEVGTLFVTALLTILGFSVHDTIVVFDRIRENLDPVRGKTLAASTMRTSNGVKNPGGKLSFEEVVGESISQTMTRSINTSFTVLLVLLAIYFFGGETTRHFALALIIGIVFGTYSSIGLASPLLVTWNNFVRKPN